MADYTRDQLMSALRKADAAGDTAAARAIAKRVAAMDAKPKSKPKATGSSIIPTMEQLKHGLAEGVGDVVEGLASVPGMIINPVGQALYDAVGIKQNYDLGDILRGAVGLPESPNGIAKTARQAAASALTGAGAARAAAKLATGPVASNVLATIGKTPIRDAVSGAGAGAGSEIGRDIGGTPGQVIGTVAGGLAGYGAANALVNATAKKAPNALAQAAGRQKVDMLPADAGGPVAKAVTTGAKASPLSVGPVVKAAQRGQDQMKAAVGRAAQSQGDSSATTDIVGRGVREAAKRYTKETAQRGSRLYTKADELAGGTVLKPEKTIAKLDEQIARVKNNPAAPAGAAAELQSFREKIAEGVNVAGLRDARTTLSQGVYDGKLRSTADKAMWKSILGDLSDDIHNGLVRAGKSEAAAKFRAADSFWKGRVEHIDEVLEPILGKDGVKSGEDVVKAIETMARGGQGGNARLSRLLGNMKPQEAGNLRATIVDRLGKANPGAQTAEGDAFAASTFLTNWNKMTPQAKASLFSNNSLRNDLNDIALLAEKMKASQAMANHSNTAVGIGANIGIQGSILAAHPIGALFGAAAQYATGRLMASPSFARALARTAKMPPQIATRSLTEQLGIIAAREPALAAEARAFQQAINDNVGITAAAEDPNQ